VVIVTPVYHAFARGVPHGGPQRDRMPLGQEDGHYAMDFAA
jgi:bifunctional pyridoxal-dependent enzyme with beta-cystathionase and maltose regulon repressor activities